MSNANGANGRGKLVFRLSRTPPRGRAALQTSPTAPSPRRMHPSRYLQDGLQEVGQAMSAGVGICDFRALVTSRPRFSAREQSLVALAQALPLPEELLLHIFSFLDMRDRARLERVSHATFALAGKLQEAINPACEPWSNEVLDCEQTMALARVADSQLATRSRAEQRKRKAGQFVAHDQRLECELGKLAANKRCLSIGVWPGTGATVMKALKEGCGWQAAVISVYKDERDFLLMELEKDLGAKGRRRELHLRLSSAACLQNFRADSQALPLTRLQVLADVSGDLGPLRILLAGPNRLEFLSLVINAAYADDLVDAMAKGCPVLKTLRLQQHAPANLPYALKSKSELRALELFDCSLQAQGLNLAALLQRVPNLEVLNLSHVKFEAGSTAGCAQALEKSALRAIGFLSCQLFMQDRSGESTRQLETADPDKHGDLALGLQHAPMLKELRLAGDTDAGEIFILDAFARNPAAQSVRFEDPAFIAQPATIERLDAIRRQSDLPPLNFS